jgi:hypothetical protein
MAPADAAEPISEQAVLDARSSQSEATVADLTSATLVGRSTVRIALAKTRFRDGPSQYRLARGCAPGARPRLRGRRAG